MPKSMPKPNPAYENRRASNAGTFDITSLSALSQHAAATIDSFSFAASEPAATSGAFGGTPVSGGAGSASRKTTGAATGTSIFLSATPSTGSGSSPFGQPMSSTAFGASSATPSTGSIFGGASSPFGHPKPATTFGASSTTSTDANPPPVMTGTSAPACSAFSNKGPPCPGTITATSYKGPPLENLRAQDYQQIPWMTGTSGSKAEAPATQTTSLAAIFSTQHSTTGSTFGGCATGTGTGTGIFTGNPAFGKPQQQEPVAGTGISISGGTSAFGQPKPAKGVGSRFGKPDPSKLEGMEELLRKSLLGEELVNTQFLLFSARSSSSGRVMKPRVLCANNTLLAKSSKYFLDLLSSDINPSDPSLVDLMGNDDIPNNARIDDYGYGSDSDLDDCDDPTPGANLEAPKDQSAASPITPSKVRAESQPKDSNELSEDDSGSARSDMFVVIPGQPRTDKLFSASKDGATSVASSGTAVQETLHDEGLGNQTAIRLRSLGSRHVLVKDTAFQTWYTLLNYLYTGKFSFRPLSSTTHDGHHESSTSSVDEPKCSAKSMYRLASKAGLGHLRDEAFSYIRSNLTEHNILQELSCSLVSKHPKLLEMELDVLFSHIASPPVVAKFATLAQRIADKEIPHGANIIVGIHARLLKERQRHPSLLEPGPSTSRPRSSGPPKLVVLAVDASDAPGAAAKHGTGPPYVDKRGLPSESSVATPSVPSSQASGSTAAPAARVLDAARENEDDRKRKQTLGGTSNPPHYHHR